MAKMDKGVLTGKPVTYPIPSSAGGVQMETFIPWTLVKRGITVSTGVNRQKNTNRRIGWYF